MARRKHHKPRGRRQPRPKPVDGAKLRAQRLENNWRIKHTDDGEILALEPGREHEQVFEGGDDPYWDAVQFAAKCLRGEQEPDR